MDPITIAAMLGFAGLLLEPEPWTRLIISVATRTPQEMLR